MADVVANPLTLILRNMKERVSIEVRDSQHALVDPTVLTLRVTDLADRPILVDQFPAFTLTGTFSTTAGSTLVTGTGSNLGDELNPGAQVTVNGQPLEVQAVRGRAQFISTAPAVGTATGLSVNKTTRIVRQDTGRYYIDWGPATRETGHPGTLAFVWQATDNTGDMSTVAQTARIVTTRTLTLLPGFRKLIDKSVKLVDDEDCFLGYTDAQLVQYLEEGLTLINAYQPYPTFCTLDHFPQEFLHVLQEAALVAGVTSQTLFAIDTDIPGYSDQGNSFVIDHGTKLAAFLNTISGRLDRIIPQMKLHFVRTGSLHIQAGTNFRLAQLLQASPNGAVFRNVFFRGS